MYPQKLLVPNLVEDEISGRQRDSSRRLKWLVSVDQEAENKEYAKKYRKTYVYDTKKKLMFNFIT